MADSDDTVRFAQRNWWRISQFPTSSAAKDDHLVNIHSHLIAAILFAFFIATNSSTYLSAHAEATTWIDTAVFSIFLSAAIFCFVCSAGYHMATCHSKAVRRNDSTSRVVRGPELNVKVHEYCHSFDYSGIVVLTVGSFYPCIYYGFFYQPLFQAIYLIAISITGVGE